MLFGKSLSQPHQNSGKVLIIGDSPKAFLYAFLLENNLYEVSFLTAPKNSSDEKLHNSLVLKADWLPSKRLSIEYTHHIPSDIDFCVLASSPLHYKTDFLLAQEIKEIPLLNFSYLYNHRLFQEAKKTNLIPVYDNTWVNLEKNIVTSLSNKIPLEIFCPLKEFSLYKPLFHNPSIELKNNSATPSFWEQAIPFVLSNLALSAYRQDLLKTLNTKEPRTLLSSALKELCLLAKADDAPVKESNVLAFLYTIPSGYKSEFLTPRSLLILQELLPQISYFDTPALYSLFKIANKS